MFPFAPALALALLHLAAATPLPGKVGPDPQLSARVEQDLLEGRWDAARAAVERELACGEVPAKLRADLAVLLARIAVDRSEFHRHAPREAATAADRALAAAREAGDPRVLATALLVHARRVYFEALEDPSRMRAAAAAIREARAAAGHAGDPRLEAEAIFHQALAEDRLGRPEAARALLEDGAARARRLGDDFMLSNMERHLAGLDQDRGELARAELGFRQSLALREQAGAAAFVPWAQIALAEVLAERGTAEEEQRVLLRKAAQLGERSGSLRAASTASATLARRLLAAGHRGAARVAAQRAVALARRFGAPGDVRAAEEVASRASTPGEP
ncbi:conserved hypothetical protein [Anaeromyxobacter dehalogenans 2CP-1]|uniref:MalT-like TPR region domain-containing protein n=1 Tax=Anaeromyxobacter dehalogenans (strain ATCC BAA-258 / DSM 21875 / 2CP-1) TaxID=455488 RepID=B8J746_ANAD2|nr:hypothetical protein [Anaeromyxobacter dehalogenans]ACL65236.1 conserved hypothetical protein [Anaeromyxobacter dehalogenans 2CP-1]